MSEQTQSAAGRYRQMMASRQPVIINVTAPSGFVFKRIKPSNFAIIFDAGELPQTAASEAAEEWQKDGLLPPDASEAASDTEKAARKALEIRDRVLSNSVDPKIVLGDPQNKSEISYAEVDPEDLAFLYKFEASRGEYSVMLAMFPQPAEQRVMAGIDSKKLRKTTKRISGSQG